VTSEQALQYIFAGINDGSIYALVAIGFNIIYNATGIINFTQGEFVIIGGITTSFLSVQCGLPIPVALAGAVLLVVAVAAIFERVAIYPMRNASILTLIVITIGGAILLRGLVMITFGKNPFFLGPFSQTEIVRVFGAGIDTQTLWIVGAMLILSAVLIAFFRLTITGKAMRACSYNPSAAQLTGIHVKKMVMLSFIISAAIAAVGGGVLIPKSPMMYTDGAIYGIKGFAAAVLGGLGKGSGAVMGGLVIGLSENFAKHINSDYKDAVAILILLVMLFVKPSGLFGKASEERYKKI
jgi:branched-chain amino acid transport system permease protein